MNGRIKFNSKNKRGLRSQRGAQLIELALVLPVILMIVFSIVGFSLVFLVQHTLSSAVSQGARSVAVGATLGQSVPPA